MRLLAHIEFRGSLEVSASNPVFHLELDASLVCWKVVLTSEARSPYPTSVGIESSVGFAAYEPEVADLGIGI